MKRVCVFSPAKINWFLDVGEVRADGYHEIASVMQMISLGDEVECELREDGEITLEEEGEACGCEAGKNLAVRAAAAMRAQARVARGMRIRLRKRIPVAAGLGGGSSNAAAVIRAAQALWGLKVADGEVREIARKLGADVPFFLGEPAAICTGVGEEVRPFAARKYWLVLWNPGCALATREVYKQFDVRPRPHRRLEEFVTGYATGNVEFLAQAVWNNLGLAAEECLPRLREMQEQVVRAGACAAWVSGSGPTVVALCRDEQHASAVAEKVKESASENDKVFVCYALTELPT